MKTIGILETGVPPEKLAPQFGSYPKMFEQLIGPGFKYKTYDARRGRLPKTPDECDAYVITGSPAGVYDDRPWIEPLKQFLVEAKGKAAMVGVCFGHQVMAEAFGGKVEKSDKGLGLGLHTYEIKEQLSWMDGDAAISIPAVHQDQIVALPPNARAVAGSDFSPNGVVVYDDHPAFSIQTHPEFDPAYPATLIEGGWEGRLTPEARAAALESLKRPNDNARVGEWIRRFLASPHPPAGRDGIKAKR